MPTTEITFKAIIRNGKLEPVDMVKLDENETVWVSVQKPIQLTPSRWDDPEFQEMRKKFEDFPELNIDREIDIEREDRV